MTRISKISVVSGALVAFLLFADNANAAMDTFNRPPQVPVPKPPPPKATTQPAIGGKNFQWGVGRGTSGGGAGKADTDKASPSFNKQQ